MHFFKIVFRRLFNKGEQTAARIVSLTTGLSFGLLLISQVFYYFSYDSFYPDASRLFIIQENYKTDPHDNNMMTHPRVSGALAPALKEEVPGVEAATRLNSIGDCEFYTPELNLYKASFVLADEELFTVFPRPVLQGDANEVLSTPMSCMVSSELAEKMGGEVMGKTMELKQYPGKTLTIHGVFEALPNNTNYPYDVMVSMLSTSEFMWDGTQNWMGNDRYYACVKLAKGTSPKEIAPHVRKLQEKYQNIEKIEEENEGFMFTYSFIPLTRMHAQNSKTMIIVLITIALSILFVSVMNYVLLTLSALIKRAKTVAIHKVCGAQSGRLQAMILSETFSLFLISTILGFLLILVLKPIVENQLGHKLSSIFSLHVFIPLLLLWLTLVFTTSYLPGRYFSRMPVATAFRNYKQQKNKWKVGLLAVQFVGASFIFMVLIIVSLQYQKIKNADHGYQTDNIFYGSTSGMKGQKIAAVIDKLESMPEIEQIALGFNLPVNGASGNNIKKQNGKGDLFNVADYYFIDKNYLNLLGIELTEGEGFESKMAASNDMVISKKGAEMLKLHNGWEGSVVGRQVVMSEHGATTIRGVFHDFIIGSASNRDERPIAFLFLPQSEFIKLKIDDPSFPCNIIVKMQGGEQEEKVKKIATALNVGMPQDDAQVKSLEMEQKSRYQSELSFRNSMIAGSLIILLITIIGLLGYTTNEANRRSKELAIRRLSGAHLSDLLKMFIADLQTIALPGIFLGVSAAWLMGNKWMQNFTTKITLHWGMFLFCVACIILLTTVIAIFNYTSIANRNPADSLRYE